VAAAAAESIDNTDISVRALALREVPILPPVLKIEYQYAHINLGNFQAYLPGRDSPNFTIPITAEFDVQVLRPVLRLWERRIYAAYTLVYFDGFNFDDNGNEHPFKDYDASAQFALDFTDDEIDPRVGMRFGYSTTLEAPETSIFGKTENPGSITGGGEDVTVRGYNLAMYFPVSKQLVLVWDNQYFSAKGGEQEGEVVAGGSPPLRGYPEGRWSDRYGVFSALEARYTVPKNIKVDFLLAHGVLEGLQYALFYELGQVSPKENHLLFEEMHQSYGAGFRLLFQAIVLRLDIANSEEGVQTYLTINQPF
jgi:outer membrane protein assembly factor BamA